MPTAIIGVGNIGGRLARDLVNGGERVILASRSDADATKLAKELGPLARASSVEAAIAESDVVVLALRLDDMKQMISQHADLLSGKVVVDPSNPVKPDGKGGTARSLPDGVSSGSLVASLLPADAHFVKAFGTLAAQDLGSAADRKPKRAVLFYATGDGQAASAIERLIRAAGFDPVKAGGLKDSLRIEVPGGDLHQHGGLHGKLLTADEARAAVAAGRRARPTLTESDVPRSDSAGRSQQQDR